VVRFSVFFCLFVFLIPFTGNAQTFTSSNLPIVVITTSIAIPDEPKITAHMGVIYNGPGERNHMTDPFNNYDGPIGIEKRGSTSQSFPKSQYGIEIRGKAGQDSVASLLGLPPEEDWVLFAPYNDKSLMRDVLAYKIARLTGQYAPRTMYCEVVLNGTYDGVYVLIEKIKRDKKRVNIAKLEVSETSGDDLTGGYIIKIDKTTGSGGGAGFYSNYPPPERRGNQTIFFQYDYPSPARIVESQRNYIRNYVADFENALQSPDFKNTLTGYRKYADVSSFVDFMIVNEVSKNVDGYRLSTFLHKDKNSKGGKLKMGPVWDFNLGFGNANYCTSGETSGFVYQFNKVCPADGWLIPFWWNRFLQDGRFKNELGTRWNTLREGPMNTQALLTYIDSVANVLSAESQQRNFQRWPVLGQYIWPNFYVGNTFQEEVTWLKNWLSNRLVWLDNQWGRLATDIETEIDSIKLEVFPNPSGREWHVNLPAGVHGMVAIEMHDSTGKKVFSRERRRRASDSGFETVPSARLPDGIYVIKIYLDGKYYASARLIKALAEE
jgi:hypothetical protein